MKFTSSLLLLGASLLRPEGWFVSANPPKIPTQTFFVPLPEKDLFDKTFRVINNSTSQGAKGPVMSIISISISTTNTIIWYDHHEDGYELGYKNETAFSAETKIWGDGDCNNGFAPGTVCTSPAHDLLKSGQSIVLENTVEVGGAANGIKFDGGDKISATYPIAITRGAYPVDPGSLMAGGVEVLDTSEWGTFFVSPIGQDVDITNDPFEHTALYIMAKDDNTTINFSTGLTAVIHSGESYTFVVTKKGQTLTASSPVQVDLIVGDIGSTYELRWFSLLPHAAWSTSYLSPVGDSVGNTQIYMYNARPNTVTVKVTLMDGTNYTRSLNGTGSGWKFTDIIPTGSGALLEGTGDFIALSITDRLTADGGQRYDWGFPVLPLNKLTETVLIGWGYGCTNKNCYNKNDVGGLARSVVWVSPIEDADIYIDLNNDGVPEADRTVKGARRLSSNIFENGNDMSGATIWAVKPNENWDSMNSVGIAAAWGQNPLYSYNNQPLSLDLGTLVPPFIGVRVDETIDLVDDKDGDDQISPGDVVQYTIQVQNAGQKSYGPCDYKIQNPGLPANLPRQTYVDGSCRFINQLGNQQVCNDASLNGGGGLCSPVTLPKRGGVHLYKFNATIGSPAEIDDVSISNQGNLTQTTLGPILPFSVPEVIHFRPSVSIEKTVHKGPLITCSNGLELYAGREREIITYCFQVTNTGNSYLDQVVVTDPGNNMTNITTIPMLAPGETTFVKFETQIPSLPIRTNATVIAEPRLVNKNIIPTYTGGPVTDSDDAGVNPIPYLPAITVKKYAGPQGSSCSIGNMKDDTYLAADTKFEYCYVVSSTGDECLLNVTLTDNSIGGIGIQSIPKLCSNDTAFTISGPGTISIVDVPSTDVSVKAIGENSGKEVTSADPAAVDIPDFAPMVSVKKYAGPPGSSCSISTMKDDVYLAQDTKFEYCYVVSNVGDECLINVTLTDAAIGGIGTQSIPKLCPFDTPISITGPTTTSLVDIAPTDASVKGKGEYSTKEVTAKDPAAIDIPAFAPRVSVKKYAGPPGSSCSIGNMQDDIFSALDTKFEYCYVISNTGNECVVDLTLSDAAVGGIGVHSITKLCPSDTAILVTGPTTTSLVDVPPTDAAVKGKGEYSGLETTAKDPAGIDIPNFAPTISIKKYAGPEGASCDVEKMKDDTYVTEDSKFEYCYVIINTGNECVLNLNIIDNAAGGIGSQGLGMVCPGDEPIEISGPPSTTIVTIPQTDAVVTGNGQYSGIAASAQDPASVEYVPLGIPSISIEKTVHLGELPTCFDGRELEYGFSGTVVTYCYEVTNTGDVLLNVVLTDVPVGTSESFPLAPGSSIFVKKVSSITSDLTSPGVVKGTPTDGRPPVEDSDPAGVKLVPDKVPCVPESDING